MNTREKTDERLGQGGSPHHFLLQAATLLHKNGTPSHRLERVRTQVAGSIGCDATFLYTPTALVVSIVEDVEGRSEERTFLRRVDSGAVNVDKLIRFDEILEQLEAGDIDVAIASQRLAKVEAQSPPYGNLVTGFACACSCAIVAVLFGATAVEIFAAFALGGLVAILEILHSRYGWEQGFLEPLAGLCAAIAALAISQFVAPIDYRLVTLAGLIVMIPGLRLTIALTELAVGHLSAGVARLAGASVSLLTISVGVAVGWRVAGAWRALPDERLIVGGSTLLAAILAAPLTFSIVFRARYPQWPVIFLVATAGFATNFVLARVGTEVAAFAGALVVGIGSNLYARIWDRPALVPFTPGIIVLVPGSIGYRSITAFIDSETLTAVDLGFGMVVTAVALVGGILTANALLPPKRIL